ncbi:MAG: CapA family protein, partial [Actinomycetota bacterium]
MSITVGLAGDTMLGRGVAEALERVPASTLWDDEVVESFRACDVVMVGLECCISERGRPWPAPGKAFFFRAPPQATEVLRHLGVTCVTLANNHALDFGPDALVDTFAHLDAAGFAWVGAGPDLEAARRPLVFDIGGFRLAVVAVTDHPADYAATDFPGVAYADLRSSVPPWLTDQVRALAASADAVLVSPHWGPNMTASPVPHVRRAAAALTGAG